MPLDTTSHWLTRDVHPRYPPFTVELRAAMLRRGVTGVRLSAVSGVDKALISKYRCGARRRPSLDVASRLADALAWPRLLDVAEREQQSACHVGRRPLTELRQRRYCSRGRAWPVPNTAATRRADEIWSGWRANAWRAHRMRSPPSARAASPI